MTAESSTRTSTPNPAASLPTPQALHQRALDEIARAQRASIPSEADQDVQTPLHSPQTGIDHAPKSFDHGLYVSSMYSWIATIKTAMAGDYDRSMLTSSEQVQLSCSAYWPYTQQSYVDPEDAIYVHLPANAYAALEDSVVQDESDYLGSSNSLEEREQRSQDLNDSPGWYDKASYSKLADLAQGLFQRFYEIRLASGMDDDRAQRAVLILQADGAPQRITAGGRGVDLNAGSSDSANAGPSDYNTFYGTNP